MNVEYRAMETVGGLYSPALQKYVDGEFDCVIDPTAAEVKEYTRSGNKIIAVNAKGDIVDSDYKLP